MKFVRNTVFLALMLASVAQAEVVLTPTNLVPNNNKANEKANIVNDVDSTQEVAYVCEGGEKQKVALTAMYGIKDNEVVVAQVRLAGVTSPGMWRVPDVLLNRFMSQDKNVRPTMWTTFPATPNQLKSVDGGKLSYADQQDNSQTIIVQNCKLDKAATAKLK